MPSCSLSPSSCSPWERAPLEPFTPALCQLLFGCGALFGIHTHLKWTQRGQFLSTPGVFSVVGGGGGGKFWLSHQQLLEGALGKWEIFVERNGSRATFVNVLIVTDSQHGLEIFRGGSLRRSKGHLGLLSLFSSYLSPLSPSVFSWQSGVVSWIAD